MNAPLPRLTQAMLPAIEAEMRTVVAQANTPETFEMHEMLTYHMGWTGEGAGPKAQGKRVRPLVVALATASAGGQWENALPAAAAVELLHNFSLLHDDIQDNSPLRRGRATVWTKWGIPQAINAGDAMFTLAHLAMLGLEKTSPPTVTLEAANILHQTCLRLTQGQYLDISYETRAAVSLDDYWAMIGGKTAALIAACTELGALIAGAEKAARAAYHTFGRDLGLAFQVQDDLLGIWGDANLTGKSAESDLVEGKKSFPVLYGLAQNGPFAERWAQGPIAPEDVSTLAAQLEAEGAKSYTQDVADRLTGQALEALAATNLQGEAGEALNALANKLLKRRA